MANILQVAAAHESAWGKFMRENCGYERISTFYSDFTIADYCGGVNAIKDTFNRSKQWLSNVKMWTELVMVLNHKIWYWYGKNNELAEVYNELWETAANMAVETFKGDDLSYYYSTTD
jgi:hypothetical protein